MLLHRRYYRCQPFKTQSNEIILHRKTSFTINGMTIHSTLGIPLNKILNELKASSDEKLDTLRKTYDQL
jgi:hypothetical protein